MPEIPELVSAIIETPWTPDLEVAVHDDELIVRFDHLPPAKAAWEDGGVILHNPEAVHCFHVRLPDGLDQGELEARPSAGTLELRVQLPA
jgi:hypothetical protein